MIVSERPLISYFEHQQPIKSNLMVKGELLFDLISARIKKTDIAKLCQSLYPLLFELRIELVKEYGSPLEVTEIINEELTIQEDNDSDNLSIILINAMRQFQSISVPIIESQLAISTDLPDAITYDTFSYFSLAMKSPDYKKMLDESLNFDCSTAMLQMYINGDLEITKKKVLEELIPFMDNALSNYGTYAILADLWYPTDKQLANPLFNKMKIKASVSEIEKGNVIPMSIETLKKLAAS